MELWYNPEDEDHRNWLENFGKKKSDNVNDNRADDFFGLKKVPVFEDWKKNTLDKLAPQVESPDGEMVELPKDMLPDRPTWEAKDEIEEEG